MRGAWHVLLVILGLLWPVKTQVGCSADAPSIASIDEFLQIEFDYLVIGGSYYLSGMPALMMKVKEVEQLVSPCLRGML